jgi:enoyl-CoA hydratase/carnithine racemase
VVRLKADRETRVLILHSDKNFAAGADIKCMAGYGEEEAKAFAFANTFNKIAALEIPTIALMEGYALGGGLELALTCDLRIAADNARMGFPEINLGIMPGAGGTVRAPRLLGVAKAKELIFTGKILRAEEAMKIGLVSDVVPAGELLNVGLELAKKLEGKAPVAIRTAKKAIDAGLAETDVCAAIAVETDYWSKLFNTKDQKEGMTAFLEKREPIFRGC